MDLLTLAKDIKQGTLVTYPGGSVSETSKIIGYTRFFDQGGHLKIAFFTERTPFHPLNDVWPDQPSDRGFAKTKHLDFKISECFVLAINKQDKTNYQIRPHLKRVERKDWDFYVGHVIAHVTEDFNPDVLLYQDVELKVDAVYRHNLDIMHSACHLVSLALSKAVVGFWKKPIEELDSLGHPNFDQAIHLSTITELKAEDHYRLGNSLKRQGFEVTRFLSQLQEVAAAVNQQLKIWTTDTDYPIEIKPGVSQLMEFRQWQCALPEGLALIPCGGSHVNSTRDLQGINVLMQQNSETEFVVITTALGSTAR